MLHKSKVVKEGKTAEQLSKVRVGKDEVEENTLKESSSPKSTGEMRGKEPMDQFATRTMVRWWKQEIQGNLLCNPSKK